MKRDNIVRFPVPDHGLSPEELEAELVKLSSELALVLSIGHSSGGLAEILSRFEKASLALKDIGQLVSRGKDRVRVAETCDRIVRSIAEMRKTLEPVIS
ncbi:hypothetical protein [uncultured Bradyrhizobium sp.]|jgi:prephenate dehydratase|uniref:hypothetical protein n=1 Tax=uncultured Bradyrhizobium sp. TaxID=199684 RepID=UPI0026157F28|nr:hypothetical protein [uncultured Bradyrhizobium sp.]